MFKKKCCKASSLCCSESWMPSPRSSATSLPQVHHPSIPHPVHMPTSPAPSVYMCARHCPSTVLSTCAWACLQNVRYRLTVFVVGTSRRPDGGRLPLSGRTDLTLLRMLLRGRIGEHEAVVKAVKSLVVKGRWEHRMCNKTLFARLCVKLLAVNDDPGPCACFKPRGRVWGVRGL